MSRLNVPQTPLLAALAGLLVPGAATWSGNAPPPAPRPPRLVFRTEFAGVDKAGDCLWRGRVDGDGAGIVTLALQQVEDPVQAANPVWHVRSHWSITGTRPDRSFSADLEGMVDWKAGVSRLSGIITSGWMRGAWVQQDGRFVSGDVSGTLEITPSLASR